MGCTCIYLWSRELVNYSGCNLNGWATTSVSINWLWQLRLLRNFTDGQWYISHLVVRYTYIQKEDMIYANHSWTWTLSRRVYVYIYICIYGKMVVYIITIQHTFIYTLDLWLGKSFASYIVTFILLLHNHINTHTKKERKYLKYSFTINWF